LPLFKPKDARTNFHNLTHHLVAEDNGTFSQRKVSFGDMEVCVADAAGEDPEEDLPSPWLRDGKLRKRKRALLRRLLLPQKKGPHPHSSNSTTQSSSASRR
jgi:hypothetical protein